MFRLSGDFIYTLAGQLRPLSSVSETTSQLDAFVAINEAVNALEMLLAGNILGLRASWFKGNELVEIAKRIAADILNDGANIQSSLSLANATSLKAAFTTFEVTLKADLSVANMYVVTNKGAYDTRTLAEFGLQAFPESLPAKVPEAAKDAQQAARCIAFDLPTAAAFHMHRAHEAVVHAYYKAIAPTSQPPEREPLGVWFTAIEKAGAPEKILSALRDINKLHRNPVLHPQDALADSGEAIALLGSVHTAMRHMLQRIPAAEMLEAVPDAGSIR